MLALIMAFWFTISFITNILGPLIPDIIHNFNLSDLAMAGFIPTSFFLAYAIMSIPAGLLIDRFGEKPVLFCGFLMPFIGTILFACMHTYPMLLASSFIIGLGMAMLQTVLNPLQRTVGGEENYAFIAELAQFMFGIASFLSPLAYTYLIRELDPATYTAGKSLILDLLADMTPQDMPWVSLYWVFTLLLLVMLIAVGVSHFPKIELKEDEKSGSKDSYLALFKQKYVWLFFLGIFCYVSTEQGTSIFMSTFLEQYHGVNPQTEGAQAVSYFWGLMTAGCLVGMILLKLIDSKRLLQVSGVLTIVLLLAALFGSKDVSLIAFPAIGFSISMMYSIVFSLALNSASQHHGSFAGILCSAIVGGAGGPMIVSTLADATSLRTGMLSILLFVGYITFIGFWARPLINNKTISLKELLKNKMMKQRYYIFLLFVAMLSYSGYAQKSILRLSQQTLMHEVRETPSPLDGQHIAVNPPRFMWPDKFPHLGPVLDGVEEEDHKPEVTYRIRIARDPEFKSEVMTAERNWAFFNPFKLFEKGNGIGSTPTLIRTAKKNGRPSIILCGRADTYVQSSLLARSAGEVLSKPSPYPARCQRLGSDHRAEQE